jgi:hypothetical protein
MTATIRAVTAERLSKLLDENHVTLTGPEAHLIDRCQTLSLESWVGHIDGKFVCAWGVMSPSVLSSEVYLWLYTDGPITTHQFTFIRRSQIFVRDLLKEYEAINGHVKTDAKSSQRWLKFLGAKFDRPIKGGVMPFRIERHG